MPACREYKGKQEFLDTRVSPPLMIQKVIMKTFGTNGRCFDDKNIVSMATVARQKSSNE